MAGYAWVYRKYCDRDFCSDWLTFEDKARSSRIGLWQESNPIPPWAVAKEKIMAEKLEKAEVVSVEDALQL